MSAYVSTVSDLVVLSSLLYDDHIAREHKVIWVIIVRNSFAWFSILLCCSNKVFVIHIPAALYHSGEPLMKQFGFETTEET